MYIYIYIYIYIIYILIERDLDCFRIAWVRPCGSGEAERVNLLFSFKGSRRLICATRLVGSSSSWRCFPADSSRGAAPPTSSSASCRYIITST